MALYVERKLECKGGEDIENIFRELKDVQVLLPLKLAPDADKIDKWQEEY